MEGIIALLIPVITLSIPIVAIWTKHQQKIAEMRIGATAEHTAEKAAQYATHIQRLEDRVQVLERIVTDRGMTSLPRSKRCVKPAGRMKARACRSA